MAVSGEGTKRMSLANVTKGKIRGPHKLVVFGQEGVGKSTFAAGAPKPVFIAAEKGTDDLDVPRFPNPETWQDVLDAPRELEVGQHDYQTVVLDTLDWAEPLLWRQICGKAKVETIEEVGGGYGKGYGAALDGWRLLLAAFERLVAVRGMNVILLAHSYVKSFKNPEGADYDRFQMKLNDRAAGLIREWGNAVLFARYETFAEKDKQTKRGFRGFASGARVLHTQYSAAFDAKNHFSLPEVLPLSWEEFAAAAQAGSPADPAELQAEIQAKATRAGGDVEKKTLDALGRAGGDAAKLARLLSWVNGRLLIAGSEKGE